MSKGFLCLSAPSHHWHKSCGDKVGTSVLGTFGLVNAELPNPDVQPSTDELYALPIKNKSDYKSISRAHIDSGIKNGTNELIILYEHRRNLLGGLQTLFSCCIISEWYMEQIL
jgi:hypothetical protein